MAVGDIAAAAGYPLVPDTGEEGRVRWGAREINRCRDFIATVWGLIPNGKAAYRAACGISSGTTIPATGAEGDLFFRPTGEPGEDDEEIYTPAPVPLAAIWTAYALPSSQTWRSVAYGGTAFVGVGYGTKAVISTDGGITWTEGGTLTTTTAQSVGYGNGVFVVTGTLTADVAVSTDSGVTWTLRTLPAALTYYGIAYGAGTFVVLGYNSSTAATSSDGVAWVSRTLPSVRNWASVAYGNGLFVAISSASAVTAVSSDGITWTPGSLPSSSNWTDIAYGNGLFIAVSSSAIYAVSSDGINWSTGSLPVASVASIAYGEEVFVATSTNSNYVYVTTNGLVWTQRLMPSAVAWNSIAYGDGSFVVLGQSTRIAAVSQ